MAFQTNLVAISLSGGNYAVVSEEIAHIDIAALKKDGLIHNASYDTGYIDEAAIVQKKAFQKYFLPESNPWNQKARAWYAALPRETMFIVVHRAEWESGL